MIKQKTWQYLLITTLLMITTLSNANSGGPLSPEQAAYDVNFYDLDLTINPSSKTIHGSLLCRVTILNPIDTLVLDLENPFTVDSVLFKKDNGIFTIATYSHFAGKLKIGIPEPVTSGNIVAVKIYYHGAPRISPNPPWGSGFVWDSSLSGRPWVGVACEFDGADIWWPCKDHPSDEPDSMSLSFTVPNPLICVSNGKHLGSIDNGDNTTTFNWFISTPINNYNVSIYAAEYLLIEETYQSVSGETIPFKFWVLPENYDDALNHMDVFLKEFNFLEEICGPFPFAGDKHGWAHAPYWGMEHQTIIAYGHDFTVNNWGLDYIHYHELAHEWWGNLVTAKDWSDVWIHEGLATYMETLYVEHLSGIERYHQYMINRRLPDSHVYPLAPREALTADHAFRNLWPYNRGASVMHTLRYHLGDETFFNLLKRWAYPDSTDLDNSDGRLCRIVTTDDMKNLAEEVTGRELDPFFEVFFRQAAYPVLNVNKGKSQTVFTWDSENNIPLDVNIPVRVNGEDQIVEMNDGAGIADISQSDVLIIDPKKWILMADPVIITSTEDDISTIADYRLEQNYPNPFNPFTTISFSLAKPEFVSLKVYDLSGSEIVPLVNEKMTAGIHEINFNGSNLASGIYYYRLHAGKCRQTKKAILMK